MDPSPQTDTYPSGQPKQTFQMKDGKLEGEVCSYTPAGQLIERAQFKAGQLDGETVVYDEQGAVAQKVAFKKGWSVVAAVPV